MNRYFTTDAVTLGETLQLDKTIAHHAIKVLRQQAGDQFELVDANHRAFLVTITTTEPLRVAVEQDITKPVELPIDVHIICGVPKSDKAELIVQKATELGVAHISFFNSQWATAKWQQPRVAKKLARLQSIAQGAAEQSHRNRIPQVDLLSWQDVQQQSADLLTVAYEESAKQGEATALIQGLQQHPKSLVTVFGPEGGLAPAEVTQLTAGGYITVGLGPRILRTETAPLYLLSAVSAFTELGGFYA